VTGLLAGLAILGWAVVTFGVVLQWRVYPDVGDGDCDTIWSVLIEDHNPRGCDSRVAFLVGVALTSALFFGPFGVAWLVRRFGRRP
jgi:hypothetical protein